MTTTTQSAPRVLGRYVLYDEIAAGGMAVVHLARMVGPVGFSRTVAIKRLHSHLAREPEFVSMFLDEARLAARIQHPNVVPTLDVVALESELFIVMEYVQGESLAGLLRAAHERDERIPVRILSAIVSGALYGLHAAHTARGERGEALGIVHRDVSPQNILVGVDGASRLLDFGIAKAIGRLQTTRDGQIKGKTSYMAPEQLRGKPVDARTDVYAAAVVLWEAVTAQRLFTGATAEETMLAILERKVPKPSTIAPNVPPELDDVVLIGLARDPDKRFVDARAMAIAIERAVPPAPAREVGDMVVALVGDQVARRAARIREIESAKADTETDIVVQLPAEVSGMSVATPQADRRRRMRVIVVAAVGAVAVAGAAVAFFVHGDRSVATTASVSVSTASTSASSVASVAASVVERSITPNASAPSTIPVSTTRPNARPDKPKPNCSPPYTIDSRGFRNPKPECF